MNTQLPLVHTLKTWPVYFQSIIDGSKTFEIRNNDRNFKVGEFIVLREFDPEAQKYTGRECGHRITYVTDFGQLPGHVVLGISSSRYGKAIELLESAIMDFEKLDPFIGAAAKETADLYREELDKIQC